MKCSQTASIPKPPAVDASVENEDDPDVEKEKPAKSTKPRAPAVLDDDEEDLSMSQAPGEIVAALPADTATDVPEQRGSSTDEATPPVSDEEEEEEEEEKEKPAKRRKRGKAGNQDLQFVNTYVLLLLT